ncbi:MAG: TIGR00153 family protein [SAR324 cluster bacterium]|nr:TIGR00153 family protein [SAR324 cluster bacterium]
MPISIFGKSKDLIDDISVYLQVIQTSGLVFYEAIKEYMNGEFDLFEDRVVESKKIEHEADSLRRDIKHKLYKFLLIPESRGDVLALLETLDDIVDVSYNTLLCISIEKPEIPDSLKEHFIKMAKCSLKSVEALTGACEAYLTDLNNVNDSINKVFFFEHEVDKIEERIKRTVFGPDSGLKFSRRVHIRYFAEKIALISDTAEGICDRLSVFVIKREV